MPLLTVVLRRTALPLALPAILSLAGCESLQSSDNFLGVITPYRVEVVQGNVVTREQAARIRPGMSRAQVRDALGSPLLTDAFHHDRWDYVFTIRRQGAEPQRRRVVLMFDGDQLKSIEGHQDLPGEREFVASIDTTKAADTPASLTLSEEQRKALPEPAKATPAPGKETPAPPRQYPPLEPSR